MPTWVKNLTTAGQLGVVALALGSIIWLAVAHIIDGAAAVALILAITGAGSAVTAATHNVINRAVDNGTSGDTEVRRNVPQ